MAPIELGNRRGLKKSQAVKVGKRIGNVVVGSVNFSYAINWLHLTPLVSGLAHSVPGAQSKTPARRTSSAHDNLDPEQDRAYQAGNDDGDHGLESVTLHPAEDDKAVAWRLDLVVEQLEAVTKPERGDLALDQAF